MVGYLVTQCGTFFINISENVLLSDTCVLGHRLCAVRKHRIAHCLACSVSNLCVYFATNLRVGLNSVCTYWQFVYWIRCIVPEMSSTLVFSSHVAAPRERPLASSDSYSAQTPVSYSQLVPLGITWVIRKFAKPVGSLDQSPTLGLWRWNSSLLCRQLTVCPPTARSPQPGKTKQNSSRSFISATLDPVQKNKP